ncbi:MAG: phosphatidylserine decarboxylase family protein [Acidobacteriota bacterium]|jgi:phosphatidylserine decarboxylase
MRVAPDALVPTLIATLPAAAMLVWGAHAAAGLLLVLPVAVLLFFRDPRRAVPTEPDLLVSPADGKVIDIRPAAAEAGEGATRVSIFLSLFNVHVNRSPMEGRIEAVRYNPGAFLPAFDDKASARNEQNRIVLRRGERQVEFVQIAGLVARRIVCRIGAGDEVGRGQRIGLIKFGSRVDLYVPAGVELAVRVGDRVRGGSTVIGRWTAEHPGPA